MLAKVIPLGLLVVVGFLAQTSTATAQIITVNPGYTPGPPERAADSGTVSVPQKMSLGQYRRTIDFGKLINGSFVAMNNSPGYTLAMPIGLNGGASWSTNGQGMLLNGNVANGNITHIRARLEHDSKNNGQWFVVATGYNSCP